MTLLTLKSLAFPKRSFKVWTLLITIIHFTMLLPLFLHYNLVTLTFPFFFFLMNDPVSSLFVWADPPAPNTLKILVPWLTRVCHFFYRFFCIFPSLGFVRVLYCTIVGCSFPKIAHTMLTVIALVPCLSYRLECKLFVSFLFPAAVSVPDI